MRGFRKTLGVILGLSVVGVTGVQAASGELAFPVSPRRRAERTPTASRCPA